MTTPATASLAVREVEERLAAALRRRWTEDHSWHPEPYDEDLERAFWLGMADVVKTTLRRDGESMDVTEARRVVNEHECRTQGHSWDIIETLGGGPEALVCNRCGVTRRVVAEEPATVV